MEPKFAKINGFVYGIYRPEGMEYGRNGIRKKLISEAELICPKGSRKDRTANEMDKYQRKLWHQKLQELLSEKDRPKKRTGSLKIKEAFLQFIENKQVVALIDRQTIENYMRSFTLYIDAVGNHAIDRFEKKFETDYIRLLRDGKYKRGKYEREGRGPITVNTHISRVNTFFKWASDAYKMPLHKISRVPDDTGKKKRVAYTWEMQEKLEQILIDEINRSRPQDRIQKINLFRLFMMATNTGMRQGEIRTLPLRNIDINNRIIMIRYVPEIDWTPKGGKERDVSISDYLLEYLLMDPREDDFFYLDTGMKKQAFLTANDAAQCFRFIQKKHGIYDANIKRWHGFRSRVTTEIAKKKGVVYAQKNAGHSSLRTTQGYIDSDQIEMLESVNVLRPKSAKNHIKNHIKNLIDFQPSKDEPEENNGDS